MAVASHEIATRWMSLDCTDDKSTLVQVMAWFHEPPSHYLGQCWPRSLLPHNVTRPQRVKADGAWHPNVTSYIHTMPTCLAGMRTPYTEQLGTWTKGMNPPLYNWPRGHSHILCFQRKTKGPHLLRNYHSRFMIDLWSHKPIIHHQFCTLKESTSRSMADQGLGCQPARISRMPWISWKFQVSDWLSLMAFWGQRTSARGPYSPYKPCNHNLYKFWWWTPSKLLVFLPQITPAHTLASSWLLLPFFRHLENFTHQSNTGLIDKIAHERPVLRIHGNYHNYENNMFEVLNILGKWPCQQKSWHKQINILGKWPYQQNCWHKQTECGSFQETFFLHSDCIRKWAIYASFLKKKKKKQIKTCY